MVNLKKKIGLFNLEMIHLVIKRCLFIIRDVNRIKKNKKYIYQNSGRDIDLYLLSIRNETDRCDILLSVDLH